jgi:hypothetical protein
MGPVAAPLVGGKAKRAAGAGVWAGAGGDESRHSTPYVMAIGQALAGECLLSTPSKTIDLPASLPESPAPEAMRGISGRSLAPRKAV